MNFAELCMKSNELAHRFHDALFHGCDVQEIEAQLSEVEAQIKAHPENNQIPF